jgi:isochorismate synthase
MALAGTMQVDKIANWAQRLQGKSPLSAFWSSKNIEEQEYVSSYINRVLQPLAEEIAVEGPCTVRADELLHLRTNFRFRLLSQIDKTVLLKQLFPTPAVCGIPKESSKEFILQHEHNSRRYYSGFSGLISLEGDTRLYVTLRCMEIKEGFCELYAGSGLMPESKEQNEFQETKAKMQPMLALIKIFK